jgi:hypothetical protein
MMLCIPDCTYLRIILERRLKIVPYIKVQSRLVRQDECFRAGRPNGTILRFARLGVLTLRLGSALSGNRCLCLAGCRIIYTEDR